ncbi:MAG: glycosyl transferase family 1 [Gammaproteobacteria bacterium]|nr:MAG: glycosyl transferase family 1 [Gammaproteobacteria bacterium]
MNILVFTASDSSFNSLRPEAEIFIELVKRGHKVTIITHADTEYGKRYAEHGITVIGGAPKKKICRDSIALVKSQLAKQSYDILFATNSKSIPNAAFAAKGSKVKLVTYRGTAGGLYRHDPSAYLTHLHPRVNGIICVSEAVRQDVIKRVWKNKQNVVAIHKGHNLDWYEQPPSDLSEFDIGADDFTVICAVNARPSKGLSVMLEAANSLANISNLHLLLVGKNIDKAPYAEQIANNDMRDRIHLTGYRHDAPQLIAASNVLVQPSVSGEGLPRAMMEAMSCGVPPVITDTGGGKEIVDDGVTGFIVSVNDADAVADRVRKLYSDPELVAAMSVRCKEKIKNYVSLDKTVDQFVDYFRKLISQA